MVDANKATAGNGVPAKPVKRVGLSGFFYQRSSLLLAVLLTAVFGGYLLFVSIPQSASFAAPGSGPQSLGTSIGFDSSDVLAFLASRTEDMILGYIASNQIWDTLFALIYGVMYVVWLSVLFRPFAHRVAWLNLLPFGQVIFDWLENFALASLSSQYLTDGVVSSSLAQLASVSAMIKWVFSGVVTLSIAVGIVARITRAIKNRKRP